VIDADDPLHAFSLHESRAVGTSLDPDIIHLAGSVTDPWLLVGIEALFVTDERNWMSGVHGGERVFLRGKRARLVEVAGGR
jgi:hypothetical protein